MKTNADMVTGAMAAETALAREDVTELEEAIEALPDNHPVKVAAAHQKQLMGDLQGLPPGHPLLIAMEEARLRYEAQELPSTEEETQAEQQKIKRAKKLEAKRTVAEERRREDERETRLRTATKSINSSMSETMESLKRLQGNIVASQEDFIGDRYALKKLERLNRILVAAIRGISESQINAGRVVANG